MSRKAFICRDTPGGVHCSMVIVGDEEETELLVDAAAEHAVEAHQAEESPELRRIIQASLKVEEDMLNRLDEEDRFDMVHVHGRPPSEAMDDEVAQRDGFSTR